MGVKSGDYSGGLTALVVGPDRRAGRKSTESLSCSRPSGPALPQQLADSAFIRSFAVDLNSYSIK
jgi:hypothetical protein